MEHKRILRKGVDKNNKYIVVTMSLHFYIYYFFGDIYYAREENKNSRSKNDNAEEF